MKRRKKQKREGIGGEEEEKGKRLMRVEENKGKFS